MTVASLTYFPTSAASGAKYYEQYYPMEPYEHPEGEGDEEVDPEPPMKMSQQDKIRNRPPRKWYCMVSSVLYLALVLITFILTIVALVFKVFEVQEKLERLRKKKEEADAFS
ncbi:unnamed protein product [Acanthoscelides obtectus]|uniref:Uncharacterized protein n=1 Tax=Acanthoscelides obtectus TaxID=200917 RepID=A0A9P0K1L8_ACAOB|nr:unnamed protein product [Acanthoscelides obtectus]CAK1657058.1 hypothetical protein AOBTE_LOCUS20093 [Acanthoscelides obtectus]